MKTARAFLSALIGLLLLIVLSACDSRQEITDAGSLTLPETVRTEAQTAATEAITSGQEQPDPEPEPDLCLYTGDTRIFSLKGGEHAGILPSHISLVRVINELENVSVAALYYEIGGSVFKADGDEKTGYGVSVPDGQTASLTPVLEIDGKTVVYCASSGALAMISGDYGFSGCEVFLTSDIEVETDLEISVPFTLDTNGCVLKAGTLVFVSSGPGEMTLRGKNGGIECSEVVCHAPEWDFCIDCILPEFEEEEHLFIDARSVNGREIDLTRLTFSSADEVNAFSDSDGVLNINDVVKTLVFSGEYDLPGQTLSRPAALVFKGTVGIPGAFTIGTVNEGEISVDTEGNSIPLLGHIKIDAPFSRLVWSGNDAPDISFAEQYINVAEYNGITLDKNAGGNNPDRLISCALDGLEGYIDGYYVTFEMPYNIMAFSEKSVLSAVSSGLSRSYLKSEGGNNYIVLEDGDKTTGYKVFCTARAYFLPRIYINTEDSKSVSSKEEYVNCEVKLDYNGYPGSEDFDCVCCADALIRGRGNSSWNLDKKPYKLKFEEKTSLFGLTAAKRWVLQANHADKSLIRNTLAMAMGRNLTNMCFVPHSYLIDLFLNGRYVGVYSLTEQIEIREGRIEGIHDSTNVDTDYLLELGGDPKDTSFGTNMFSGTLTRFVEIKDPGAEVLTKEQYDYISDYVGKADQAVRDISGYEEYIDVDSLIDWFILHEFSYNLDCTFRRSVYLLKKQGGKLFLAAPWDFDYAFGNFNLDSDKWNDWICLGNTKTDNYDMYIWENWMDHLLTDKNFTKKLKARWNEVKGSLLGSALDTIDEAEAKATASALTNYDVWQGVMGNRIQYEKKSTAKIDTYAANLEFLRTFINNRYNWIDKNISKLPVK